jgi:hypothetical protein
MGFKTAAYAPGPLEGARPVRMDGMSRISKLLWLFAAQPRFFAHRRLLGA